MAKAQPAMLTEENTPKVKKLPIIKRKAHLISHVIVLVDKILISQIEEIQPRVLENGQLEKIKEGWPDCRLIQPFLIVDKENLILEPYLKSYTDSISFEIVSSKIVTLAKPNAELQAKYENLIQE